tara:strand:- start:88 stop:570 length:483 start_codon:yes stop_codon:yes gene_type:complete
MKKYITLLIVPVIFFYSGCATTHLNDSEKSIHNKEKDFIVLGNLKVIVGPMEHLYDKVMNSAIKQYGNGVDVINIKRDKGGVTTGTIINCLVIKYDNHITKQDFKELSPVTKRSNQICDCYKALNDGIMLSENCQKIFQQYSLNTELGRLALERDAANCE